MFNLTGRVALITGATGCIGGAIARVLHRMGATVAVSGTKLEYLENLATELSERVHLFSCNLGSTEAIEDLVPNVERIYGKIDILVNNAGIIRDNIMIRMSDEDWQNVLNINLEAPFRLMRAVSKRMIKQKWGRIVNISSVVGSVGNPGQTNYAASKSGLFGLSKSAAIELASRNITVNCVAPGFIESTMIKRIPAEHRERLEKSIPMNRAGLPEEVAVTVGFLASEEASYITGHVMHVNGGMVMI
jgi:3-oxoacyl-[acyl-carrier protein] reductase